MAPKFALESRQTHAILEQITCNATGGFSNYDHSYRLFKLSTTQSRFFVVRELTMNHSEIVSRRKSKRRCIWLQEVHGPGEVSPAEENGVSPNVGNEFLETLFSYFVHLSLILTEVGESRRFLSLLNTAI